MITFNEILNNLEDTDKRIIPGIDPIENQCVLYFQDHMIESVEKQFYKITNYSNPPKAANGGANLAGCKIILPNGKSFHALVFHGDLEGWKADIENATTKLNISLGNIINQSSFIVGNLAFNLDDCTIEFY
ncbi:hypothetical protein [Moraxella atlantae]|uniref:Uncharacterized protein n=1 Tax=Faucicola atlantae TaxID=34059 RepID=A0A378QLQ1_9GAMM|nr:hypothetical protein [Moraxella atlantae]OPH36193.1 hypothetical protein B5J92_04060 [Moraxella atlantae]STZ01698.1 Uncharacterised protein [Moraxella atlantae]